MIKLIDKVSRIFTRKPDSPMVHVFEALDNSLNLTATDLMLLELQYSITTATGIWLDEYGTWFGVARDDNESDIDYGQRIIASTLALKNTIPAIVRAIRSYMGDENASVNIYEPYTDIFRYNMSGWSLNHRFPDGIYYTHAVIDIQSPISMTPGLKKVIDEIRSAGIKVYYTMQQTMGGTSEPIEMFYDSEIEPYYGNFINMKATSDSSIGLIYSLDKMMSGDKILWGAYNDRSHDIMVNTKSFTDPYPVDVQTTPLGTFTLSSQSILSEYRGAMSGYKQSPYDLLNPIPFEDTGIILDPGTFIDYVGISKPEFQYVRASDMDSLSPQGFSTHSVIHTLSGDKIIFRGSGDRGIHMDVTYPWISVLSGSMVLLEEIWDMTIEEVDSMEDNSQFGTEITISSI